MCKVFRVLKRVITYIVVFLCVVLVLLSCSTHKDKWANRKYHSITAHYNALWNGKEALKECKRTIDQNWKDDYTRILPIYVNGTNEQASAIKSNTDRAIEKGGKVIKSHSMRFSGIEKNPQIDDAYLLIGQSCYYAHDYKAAEASFQYVIANWKNRQEIYEPMLWLALTYCKEKKHAESEIVLKQVLKAIEDGKAPKKLKKMLHLVWAENDIAQGKTLSALQNLQLRKKNIFEKKLNTRTKFIEGQIYMNNMQYAQASKCFKYTARHASEYSMQFVSQLNIALCFDPTKKNSISIIEDLEKMLDDTKNEEYLDQIYYAIGEVYYRNRSYSIACKKWEESVKYSKTNKVQKMASALRAANVYYDTLQNYVKAQLYYDTALSIMDKDYPSRDVILSRQRVLTSLVENLNIITRWDSLLALSELSKEKLDAKIEKWITDYKIEKKRQEEQAKIQQAIMARNASMNNFNQLNQSVSNFYFSNPTTVQSGRIEFQRKWGDRELEDNWRLLDKQEMGMQEDTLFADTGQQDSISVTDRTKIQDAGYTPDMREYYTKDIPFSQGAKDTANAQIADALLEAGYIFFQGINNTTRAIETFIDLLTRYPQHINVLPASYHLYRLYDQRGDYPNSNFYKNKVLAEYPESEYTAMIKNPDYLKDVQNNNTLAERLYREVYQNYSKNEYLATVEKGNNAVDSLHAQGEYVPRLKFLVALSKGKLYGVDSLADNLNMIIYNHPNSEVTPIIEQQLRFLSDSYNLKDFDIKYDSTKVTQKETDNNLTAIIPNDSTQIDNAVNRDDILDAESLVYRNKDMQHYYLIFFDDSKIDVAFMEKIISDFNKKEYSQANLQTTSQLFTLSDQMIIVRKFANQQEALKYLDSLQEDDEFSKLSPSYYRHCVISIQNYSTLYSRRNIDAYLKYFRLMYLKDRENNK